MSPVLMLSNEHYSYVKINLVDYKRRSSRLQNKEQGFTPVCRTAFLLNLINHLSLVYQNKKVQHSKI